jgi:hypothetical protein
MIVLEGEDVAWIRRETGERREEREKRRAEKGRRYRTRGEPCGSKAMGMTLAPAFSSSLRRECSTASPHIIHGWRMRSVGEEAESFHACSMRAVFGKRSFGSKMRG